MSAQIIVQQTDGTKISWKTSWKVASDAAAEPRTFQTANVTFEPAEVSTPITLQGSNLRLSLEAGDGSGTSDIQANEVGGASFDFLLETLRVSTASARAIKLIAPRGNGNIIRSDIVPHRMWDVEHVEKSIPLAQPLQLFSGEQWTSGTDFITLLKGSIGALVLHDDANKAPADALDVLEKELDRRLSIPLLATSLKRQTMIVVEGGDGFPFEGKCSKQLYDAGKALGLDLVVLAVEGHDLQRRPEFADWIKAFIPIECGYDVEFPTRIAAAARQYAKDSGKPLGGIVTTFESYHVFVAAAAEELGLPHEPVAAYEVATDKFKTSLAEGRKSFTASNVDEALQIARTEEVWWPIIIKPCRGWASELVFKVDNIEQLEKAAPRMAGDRHGASFVMEHYCDGPEVDINIIMYDGKVLFYEIGDENPKSADAGSESFGEQEYLLPSLLPKSEQQTIYESVLNSITRLGFKNGIYHCEARLDNSTTEWTVNASGAPQLVPRKDHNGVPATSWLIEINTRPPGLDTCDVIETTWGVDYQALTLATKLSGASEVVRALSTPYQGGAQYHADKVWVLTDFDEPKRGIWESGNVTEELVQRRPDLARHISKHVTFAKKGDKIPHPKTGVNRFVAYLHVFSRESREHLLELATDARRDLRIEFS